MPTQKIKDLPKHLTCKDFDHEVEHPGEPGEYRHTCRACRQVTLFTVLGNGGMHIRERVPSSAEAPKPPCPRPTRRPYWATLREIMYRRPW